MEHMEKQDTILFGATFYFAVFFLLGASFLTVLIGFLMVAVNTVGIACLRDSSERQREVKIIISPL